MCILYAHILCYQERIEGCVYVCTEGEEESQGDF
jgi:hypothetical protein